MQETNLEYAGTPLDIRGGHVNLPVKASRTQEGLIKNVHAVGGGQHDHIRGARVEAVHLHQQLVQRVLCLALATHVAAAAFPAHRVDFVDEKNAGRVFARQGEHVPDPGWTHADKHLQKFGPRHREEGNIRCRTKIYYLKAAIVFYFRTTLRLCTTCILRINFYRCTVGTGTSR